MKLSGKFLKVLKFLNFFRKKYETLNKIEVSRDKLLHNYRYLISLDKRVKIAPVLKSNAYGHGIVQVAKILDPLGAPYFCVDSLFEAYQLQKAKVKTPILIMGYTNPENFKVKKLPFSFAIYDIQTARVLNEFQPGCKVHIFVDTGMHREGIPIKDLPKFLTAIKQFSPLRKASNLVVEGLMSHLASADDPKDPLNKIQVKNFKKALEILKKHKINPRWRHLSNSAGLLNRIPAPDLVIQNMARIGLALYGISHHSNFKPVLTLKSKLIQIKKLNKGDKVGYGGTHAAKENLTIGILPIGYYDGVDRRLSNKGYILVDRIPYPVLGKVSMNITVIDISKVPDPKVGQEVTVYSKSPTDKNSLINCAKICQTIPYDLLVNLAETTRRTVV